MATDLFGEWKAHTDGQAHYVLRGRPLCRAVAGTTSSPIRDKRTSQQIIVPHCRTCFAANFLRWAGAGAAT